jgi:hypothetical protein
MCGWAVAYRAYLLIQDDRGRREKTELGMIQEAERLKNLTKTLGEEEIDSVDSLIYAYEFRMRMGDFRLSDRR